MKIHYTLTERAYLEFNLYHISTAATQRKIFKLWRYLPAALLFCFCSYLAATAPDRSNAPVLLLVAVAGAAFWILYYPIGWRKRILKTVRWLAPKERNDFLGDYSIELCPDALHEESPSRSSDIAYSQISRIIHHRNQIYIYTDTMTASVVPYSAFTDEAERENFLRLLEAYRKKETAEKSR